MGRGRRGEERRERGQLRRAAGGTKVGEAGREKGPRRAGQGQSRDREGKEGRGVKNRRGGNSAAGQQRRPRRAGEGQREAGKSTANAENRDWQRQQSGLATSRGGLNDPSRPSCPGGPRRPGQPPTSAKTTTKREDSLVGPEHRGSRGARATQSSLPPPIRWLSRRRRPPPCPRSRCRGWSPCRSARSRPRARRCRHEPR